MLDPLEAIRTAAGRVFRYWKERFPPQGTMAPPPPVRFSAAKRLIMRTTRGGENGDTPTRYGDGVK